MKLTVKRLSSVLGAEVGGLEAREIGDNLFKELHQIWLDHDGLVVLRDQKMTPDEQLKFSRRFGKLLPHNLPDFEMPGYPEIFHYVVQVKEKPEATRSIRNGSNWHAAHTYEQELAGASICHTLELPPRGGDMFVSNMYQAYDALSEPMKRLLRELKAVHRHPGGMKIVGDAKAVHPLVMTHPESGRTALFASPTFTTEILGVTIDESDALLKMLFAHCTRPEYIYRHHWQVGDLLIWDDRCNMHYALSDFAGGGRIHQNRTSAAGFAH